MKWTVFLQTRKTDKSISWTGKINAQDGQSLQTKNDFENIDNFVFEKILNPRSWTALKLYERHDYHINQVTGLKLLHLLAIPES